jgi:subtilisin family serine protease
MRFFDIYSVVAALALAITASASVSTVIDSELQKEIEGSYIIKLRSGHVPRKFFGDGNNLAGVADKRIRHIFDYGKFQGFSGKFTKEEIAQLRKDGRVEYIEPEQIFTISAQQNNPPSWGLTRISQRIRNLSQPYIYPDNGGAGIDVWVIDTGIQTNHTDFGGRATIVKNYITSEANTDLNGHGTHVAGVVGSFTYGVAKNATIYGVKVLNQSGSGTTSNVIAAIQYVAANARPGKSVANLSLNGSKSTSVNNAIAAAVSAGVPFIVAAGNNYADACNYSPPSSTSACTVAASTSSDAAASTSNYGSCVDIYAPGMSITSLWIGEDGATATLSGSSVAAAHVAGVAALYLASDPSIPASGLCSALSSNATSGVLTGVPTGTPNKLVYNQISAPSRVSQLVAHDQ